MNNYQKINNKFYSPKGRIIRKDFNLILLFLFPIGFIINMMLDTNFDSIIVYRNENAEIFARTTAIISSLFYVYIEVCAIIKRLRDLQFSPWFVFFTIIPIFSLFIIIPCMFFKSKIQINKD